MLKKAAISIVLLGAAGLAGYWVYNQQSAQAQRHSPARFLPQETLLFVEAPDLEASAQRWRQTGLAAIFAEPEVKSFLEKPLARLRKEAPALGVLRRIQARQGFVAITRVDDNNMPYGVLGVSSQAPREQIAALIEEAKKKAQEASPHGKSELTKYKNYEIESFSSGDITVAGTFAGEWYLVANSVDLLKETLDRFDTPSGEGRLADLDIFKHTLDTLPSHAEARGFAQPQFFYEKIISLSKAGGNTPSEAEVAEMKKVKGVAGAISFDGPLIREMLYVYAPGMRRQANLGDFSLGLTSPNTLIYMGMTLPPRDVLDATLASNPGFKPLEAILQQRGLALRQVTEAVGEELGFYGEWPIGSMMPGFALAVEIKDAVKARNILDALPEEWSTSVKDDVVYKSMPPLQLGAPISLAPSIALTDKALIATLDRAALEGLVAKSKEKGDTLEKSMTYKEAQATVGKPDNQIIYIDAKTFFERFYGTLRPMLQVSGAFIPGVADVVDLSKLPGTETIANHLRPSMATNRYTSDGSILESTGTLSIQGTIFGGAIASSIVFATNMNKLQSSHADDGEEAAPATPAAPEEPAAPAASPTPEETPAGE